MKHTKEELADELISLTLAGTDVYFEDKKNKTFDKQLWAFLHLGFITALRLCGYSEEFVKDVLNLTQQKMIDSGVVEDPSKK